jgi:diaminopimelate epimerase
MRQRILFAKMHGIGNDFVLINAISQRLIRLDFGELAKNICNRHYGIGADGLLIIQESLSADLQMRVFNPDGSEAEMCGNGIRCFSKFVYENKIIEKEVFSVETLAGIIVPALIIKNGQVAAVEVDMGIPFLDRGKIPMKGNKNDLVIAENIKVGDTEYTVTCVSTGNPHVVVFVDDISTVDITKLGPMFENHPLFPEKINTEFAQIINRKEVISLIWERGAGNTLACGTGASAVVVAGVMNNKLDRKAIVHLPGGDLSIEWQEADDHLMLTGSADFVYKGEILV